MVGVSGFRGRVGRTLTPELIAGIAASYGDFLRSEGDGGPVVVGRDSRTSGSMLERATVAGLLSVGCPVVELGVVPTPTLMLAVRESGAAGGLAVTASHNPAEWNALKFAVRGGTFLPPARMERFQARVRSSDPSRAAWDALGGVTRDDGAVERHVKRILELPFVEPERIRAQGLRVAVDCVNGAGGVILPSLLERLGCEVHAVGLEPHGRFHRDPEPTAASLAALGALVERTRARIGMAVDPDADRLSLVDDRGRPLGEDLTLALAADVVLRRRAGTVVTNLSTSRVVEDVAELHGGRAVRAPVGEINVVVRMVEEKAVVGGEGNGGVIVPALHHTRDAAAGAALLLQFLTDEPGTPLSARVSRLPGIPDRQGEGGLPEGSPCSGVRCASRLGRARRTGRAPGTRGRERRAPAGVGPREGLAARAALGDRTRGAPHRRGS